MLHALTKASSQPHSQKIERRSQKPSKSALSRGRFVVLEGLDGSGKSTFLQVLKQRLAPLLAQQNKALILTREPGGCPTAEALRQVVLDGKDSLDPLTELFIFEAARREHLRQVILPALHRGDWVLCDRFTLSTLAYQGFGRGLGFALTHKLNKITLGSFREDLTIWLKVTPRIAQSRRNQRSLQAKDQDNRLDREAQTFHNKVSRGFQTILKQRAFQTRLVALDATNSPENMLEELFLSPKWKALFPR